MSSLCSTCEAGSEIRCKECGGAGRWYDRHAAGQVHSADKCTYSQFGWDCA